ncbi:transmembrane channel-like protein 7 isoform X1 [Procambarus clarkii]|uniref:transmembrane channel-like protein 7 isoform X1 n=1 Tax=Procambarus clarkii TaxID=6728 RepID=UPI001E673FBD|nr:transmembrane channel-like protein 7 [Procambarus clarkii]XP_045596860.1 transmembrane channel-like protein 7 [Procambarus clarkii]XP_045596866.1 transmembrane channel-like protein 7 [Procambarus clarkii]
MSGGSGDGAPERDDCGRAGVRKDSLPFSSERYNQDNRYTNNAKNSIKPSPVDHDLGDGPSLLSISVDREVLRLPRVIPRPSWRADQGYQRLGVCRQNTSEVNMELEDSSHNLEHGVRGSPKSNQERKEKSHLDSGNDYNYDYSQENWILRDSMSQHKRSEMGPRRDHIPLPRPTRRGNTRLDAREQGKVTQEQPPHVSHHWDDWDATPTDTEAVNLLVDLLPSQIERKTGTLRLRGVARPADPTHAPRSPRRPGHQHHSEAEIVEALERVKEQPWPMARRRTTRQQLLQELEEQEARWYSVRPVARAVRKGTTSLTNFLWAADPLRRVLKRIEGRFGTSVVAVFNFIRSMMQLNLVLALLLLGAVVVPSAYWTKNLNDQDYTWQVTGDTSRRTNIICSDLTLKNSTMARECNRNYTDYIQEEVISHKHNVADLLQDFLQGTGFLEWTLLFAGYYPAYAGHSHYTISLAYILTVLTVYLVSLVYVVYFAAKFLRQFMVSSSKHSSTYSNTIFAGWDFTVSEAAAARIEHTIFVCGVKAAFDDEKYMKKRLDPTRWDRATLYLTRVLINLLVLALAGGSWTGIYFLAKHSQKFVSSSTEDVFQEFIWQYAPTAIVALLNILYPLIFKFMVKYEHYRGRTELLITLARCALIRLMSLSILVVTKLTLISQHADTCDPTVNKYICWETHLGQQVYSVLVLDLLIQTGMTFVVNTTRCGLGRIDNAICKRVSIIEFDVPGHVLDVVYAQAICWLGVQHVPLMAPLCFIYFCILFVLKLFTVQYTCVPAARLYRASRSAAMFMTVLSFALLVCIIPNGVAMLSLTPSKACSPFRGLNYQWQSLTYYICNMDDSASWIRWVLWRVDDAVVGVTVLVVLCLLLLYYVSVNKARSALVNRLEKKLRLAAKDKTFLVQDYKRAGGHKHRDTCSIPGEGERAFIYSPSPA